MTGRIYLNVLGIFRRSKTDELFGGEFRDDDVNAKDLGGRLVDVAALHADDRDIFARFLKMADKACAHLTTPDQHPWPETHEAIRRVCRYLKTHLYDESGRSSTELDAVLQQTAAARPLVNVTSTSVVVVHDAKPSRP